MTANLETKAKVDLKSNEFDNEANNDDLMPRRIRPALTDLSEYGKRYKGKNVTRKDMQNSEDEEDSDEEESEVEDDEEIEEDQDEEEDEESEDEDTSVKKPLKNKVPSKNETNQLKLINLNHNEEIAKGKAVKNQLSEF